jgi:cell shape-determining protein MreC
VNEPFDQAARRYTQASDELQDLNRRLKDADALLAKRDELTAELKNLRDQLAGVAPFPPQAEQAKSGQGY